MTGIGVGPGLGTGTGLGLLDLLGVSGMAGIAIFMNLLDLFCFLVGYLLLLDYSGVECLCSLTSRQK